MDVWFDSGSSWAGVLQASASASQQGQPGARTALSYPADLYLEGQDQHRGGWVSYVCWWHIWVCHHIYIDIGVIYVCVYWCHVGFIDRLVPRGPRPAPRGVSYMGAIYMLHTLSVKQNGPVFQCVHSILFSRVRFQNSPTLFPYCT